MRSSGCNLHGRNAKSVHQAPHSRSSSVSAVPHERTVFLTIPVRVGRLVILFVRIVVGISPIVLIVILVLDNSVVATQAFVQTG